MKKMILFFILTCSVAFAQTNTIHIEVMHETCDGPNEVLFTGDFDEGGTFEFAGATLPLTLAAWQSYYDLFVGAGLSFPTGSIDNHIEVYVTLGSLDCDNPGLLADPTGQGFDIFMFIDITVYLNDEPIHMEFPAGTEPTLTFQNAKLIQLLISKGVFNMNDISFGYFDGGTFTSDGISISVGMTTTTLTLSHFSQFGGGLGNILTDVEDEGILPNEFQLYQNYPNPFNPETIIKYSVPEENLVTIKLYDILGNEVSTLFNNIQSVGTHDYRLNAAKLTSGIYFYTIKAGNFFDAKKMLLLK